MSGDVGQLQHLEPLGVEADSKSAPKKLKEVPHNKVRHWLMFSYAVDILIQERRTIAGPGFHEHHLSGKILARVIFPHGNDLSRNIAVEVPLWDTGIMSSSQAIQYFNNLILMLVSWLDKKWVSKWMGDFQRKDEELLLLGFCDHCMSVTTEIREFRDSPLLESFHRFPQLSIAISMTFYEPGHSDKIGCWVEKLEILTKLSSPILRSTNLLLKVPWSREKIPHYIEMLNFTLHGNVELLA